MKLESYIQSAKKILLAYEYPLPFHLFLKNYFKNNKQFGSRDRKTVAALLFGFFRIGHQAQLSTEQAMQAGMYLCNNLDAAIFEKLLPKLAPTYAHSTEQKIEILRDEMQWRITQISVAQYVSPHIDVSSYQASLLTNAKVFIRCRANAQALHNTLEAKEIAHTMHGNAISFNDNLNLQEALPENKLYVIQDLSSQQVCELFKPQANEHWWDCCAASGGKSIALLDAQKNINLTVSDVRENILHNLTARFKQYNYAKYKTLVIDMCSPIIDVQSMLYSKKFNRIICDVPCSGSGTWARTPEQMYYFNEDKLSAIQQKQISILQNALLCLEPKGLVFYITCSVFASENEDVINKVLAINTQAKLINQQYISNIKVGADSMFVAIIEVKG